MKDLWLNYTIKLINNIENKMFGNELSTVTKFKIKN